MKGNFKGKKNSLYKEKNALKYFSKGNEFKLKRIFLCLLLKVHVDQCTQEDINGNSTIKVTNKLSSVNILKFEIGIRKFKIS